MALCLDHSNRETGTAMYYLRDGFKWVGLGRYVPMLATSHPAIFLRGGRAFFLLLKSMKREAGLFSKTNYAENTAWKPN